MELRYNLLSKSYLKQLQKKDESLFNVRFDSATVHVASAAAGATRREQLDTFL